MDEQDTFNKLKQTPFADVLEEITQVKKNFRNFIPSFIATRLDNFQSSSYDVAVIRAYAMHKCLKEHGWEYEDFIKEMTVLFTKELIDEYNAQHVFPDELINQVKDLNPNVELIPAQLIIKDKK